VQKIDYVNFTPVGALRSGVAKTFAKSDAGKEDSRRPDASREHELGVDMADRMYERREGHDIHQFI
jgi:hypothetical protein